MNLVVLNFLKWKLLFKKIEIQLMSIGQKPPPWKHDHRTINDKEELFNYVQVECQ